MSEIGNRFLEAGKQNFKQRLEQAELSPIRVPEWDTGSDECIVYRPASISVQRISRIQELISKGGLEHTVQVIIEVARTEDGKPMFKQSDRDNLLKYQDPQVVIRVSNELAPAITSEGLEEIKSNLDETANSETNSS